MIFRIKRLANGRFIAEIRVKKLLRNQWQIIQEDTRRQADRENSKYVLEKTSDYWFAIRFRNGAVETESLAYSRICHFASVNGLSTDQFSLIT